MAKKIRIDKNFQTKFEISINGKSCRITIPVLGKHFVYSVLAAAAVGYSQKIPFHLIENGFKLFKKLPHRMTPIKLNSGAVILDDTYNSNPLGAKAAIDVLSEIGKGKKKIAVLGDMLELGSYTEAGHEEVGEYAAKKGIDTLVCIGDFANFLVSGAFKGRMNKKNVLIFPHKEEAKTKIKELVYKNSFVLFKASRKLKFEDLVNYLRE